MVRRVGFGEEEKEEEPHKLHVGRDKRLWGIMHRVERARAKGSQAAQMAQRKPTRPKHAASGQARSASIFGNLMRLTFLFFWLLGWTAAIMLGLAMFAHASGLIAGLLLGWLGFAAIAWLVAAIRFLVAVVRLLRAARSARQAVFTDHRNSD
jgi:membrane associated rhomboid family serine protease